MFISKINIKFILLLFPLISLIGGLWQGQYTNDGYHWGFVFSNALDLLEGKKPYKEIFIQYGLLSTFIHAILLFLFERNIYSLIAFTSLIYSISIYIIGLLTFKFTENKVYSIFSVFIIFTLYPWPTSPWSNFISFFFITLFCYLYASKNKFSWIISGISFSFAYLSLTLVYNYVIFFFYISLIILLIFLYKKIKYETFQKNLYFLISSLFPIILFFVYLYQIDVINLWFTYQKIPFLLADVYDISLIDRIKVYFEFLTIYSFKNFIYEPQFVIYALFIFSNLIYLLFYIFIYFKEKKITYINLDFFIINLLIFFLNFKAQVLGIEKLATSISLGVLTLMFFINKLKERDNKFILNFIVIFVCVYSVFFSYDMNNSHYAGARSTHLKDLKNTELKYRSNKISYFTLQKWSNETWHQLNKFVEIQKKIKKKCNINYASNLTSNTFFYALLDFKTIQLVPFVIKTHSSLLRKHFDKNLISKIQSQINQNNIFLISFENNDKLFNLDEYAKPILISTNINNKTLQKKLYLFFPKKCKI